MSVPQNILVFINYRTCDEPFAAALLYKHLVERLGKHRVFRDSSTIRPGANFPTEIRRALQQCRVMIVVIGKRWLHSGPDGRRLIDDPDDWVRIEIADGLSREDVTVVPILVGDVSLPDESMLPPDIAGLASQQHVDMRARSADRDAARVVDDLVDLLGEVGSQESHPPQAG
jgi:hypothetical protein